MGRTAQFGLDGVGLDATGLHRVRVDGRAFAVGPTRFRFLGASYGTFTPRAGDGALLPPPEVLREDMAAMGRAGLTVVRVYTGPTPDLLDAAARADLRVFAGLYAPDWRDVIDLGRRQRARIERDAERAMRAEARRLAGDPRIIALCIGNEVPGDVVRWLGAERVRTHLRRLASVIREEDPDALITYANYPTTEYLPTDLLDFATYNVFLDRATDLRLYLMRLMNQVGDVPLVVGELGRHCSDGDDELLSAPWLEAQLAATAEAGVAGTCIFSWTDEWAVGGRPVEGWRFGLTREDRSPRPALGVVHSWSTRGLRDLRPSWPRISVVVCAHNEDQHIGECLERVCDLDYPDLEVVVVDDGSTDGTAEVARRHPVTLLELPHGGLSAARNAGWGAARGEIVAFLDADAYPSFEWPYHLALAFEDDGVGAAGGPNVGPPTDGATARCVAAAPGGPNAVLLDDESAEHVPGCNLAVRRVVLEEVDGFDPLFRTAGDDVDLCWRVLERHHRIGWSPGALVWHHRRGTVRGYLRQQRGYGRAERLVEARHPDRCSVGGSIRWQGHIYAALPPALVPKRVYRGLLGSAAFQSVYGATSGWGTVVHQIGVPVSTLAGFGAALAWITAPAARGLALGVGAAALTFLLWMIVLFALRASRTRAVPSTWRHRGLVGALCVLQPLARRWGRHRRPPRATSPASVSPHPPVVTVTPRGAAFAADRPREQMALALIGRVRERRMRVRHVTGWEDHDGEIVTGWLLRARLVTSGHPVGIIQAKVVVRPNWRRTAGIVAAGAIAALLLPLGAVCLAATCTLSADLVRGGATVARARSCLREGRP